MAKHAGVSLMTVSRALNDKQAARPQTRERIKRAIKALDYTPNSAAKSLASGTASNLEKR